MPAPILRGAPVGEIGYDPDSDEPAHLPSEREFRWLEEAGRPERPGEPLRTDDPRRIAAAEDRDGPERVKRRRSEYVVDVETGRLVAWRYVDEPRIMVGRRYATWGVGQPFPRRPVALLHRRGRARRRFCAPRRRRHTGTSASRGDPPQGDDDPPHGQPPPGREGEGQGGGHDPDRVGALRRTDRDAGTPHADRLADRWCLLALAAWCRVRALVRRRIARAGRRPSTGWGRA